MFEIPYHTRCRVRYHILTYDFIYYIVYTYDIVGHIVGQDTVLANRTYDIIGHVVIEISLEIVFFVNAWHSFRLQETEADSADERPNLHSLPDESGEPAVGDVVAVEGGAPMNQSYSMSEGEDNEDGRHWHPAVLLLLLSLRLLLSLQLLLSPRLPPRLRLGPKWCRLDLCAIQCNKKPAMQNWSECDRKMQNTDTDPLSKLWNPRKFWTRTELYLSYLCLVVFHTSTTLFFIWQVYIPGIWQD